MAPWWLRASNDERPVDSPAELEAFAGDDDFLDANPADDVDDSTIIATVSGEPVSTATVAGPAPAAGQDRGWDDRRPEVGRPNFGDPKTDDHLLDSRGSDDDLLEEPGSEDDLDESESEEEAAEEKSGSERRVSATTLARKRRRRRKRRPGTAPDPKIAVETTETAEAAPTPSAVPQPTTPMVEIDEERVSSFATAGFSPIPAPVAASPEPPPARADRPKIATPPPQREPYPAVAAGPASTPAIASSGLESAHRAESIAEGKGSDGPGGAAQVGPRAPKPTPPKRHEPRRGGEDRAPRAERLPAPRTVVSRPEPGYYQPATESDHHLADLGKTVVYAMHDRPSNTGDERKIAMFVDFENIALGVRDSEVRTLDITLILERLLEKGKIIVKKAYADWERYSDFKRPFHEAAIELIDIPQKFYSGKNSADIKMVVDAMDLCYSKEHLDTFVLVSGDSDFSPLVSKLKENNKYVIGLGVKNSSSHLLIDNCDEFIYYEDVWRDAQRVPRLDHLQPKETECFQLLCEAIVALLRENKDLLWGSLVKQTMQRKRPSFNEGYFGYSTFTELLEDAERKGIIRMRRDQRSGTHIVVGFAPRSKR